MKKKIANNLTHSSKIRNGEKNEPIQIKACENIIFNVK
jgi:mannitol-1-phosphate/altronate dehydrogenase